MAIKAVDPVAYLSRHLVAPLWAAWEHSPYLEHYRRHLLQSQFDSPETIRARQDEMLQQIFHHAYRTTSFWRRRFETAGIRPANVRGVDDLPSLPLLTKNDLRGNLEEMISNDYAVSDLHRHKTSGSTGVSVVTYRDEACQQLKRAATLRADEWSGWRLGERVACIWGNPQLRSDWKGRLRRALLTRDYLYLDTLKMDASSMRTFVNSLIRTPTSLLFGHAHSLYLLANFITTERPDVRIRPRAIISTCMVLHDFERRKIEQVFDCRVSNRYGCEELSLIASECDQHQGLHVNSDCLYVEIIDEHGAACAPEKPGRVVVTDLLNRAMPLIRYEVGDVAAWANGRCSCGRTLPRLSQIEGRVADFVVTSRGEYISGISLTENFALLVPGIVQMQIIQEEVDRFVYNIVRDANFNDTSLQKIAELTGERFGRDVHYDCRFLSRIAPEPSGKFRFCISKVHRTFS